MKYKRGTPANRRETLRKRISLFSFSFTERNVDWKKSSLNASLWAADVALWQGTPRPNEKAFGSWGSQNILFNFFLDQEGMICGMEECVFWHLKYSVCCCVIRHTNPDRLFPDVYFISVFKVNMIKSPFNNVIWTTFRGHFVPQNIIHNSERKIYLSFEASLRLKLASKEVCFYLTWDGSTLSPIHEWFLQSFTADKRNCRIISTLPVKKGGT